MKQHITTFDELGKKSVTDLARELLKEGNDPDDQILVYRFDGEGKYKLTPDLIVTNIGVASKWTTQENNKYGPRIVRYKPLDPPQSAVSSLEGTTVERLL